MLWTRFWLISLAMPILILSAVVPICGIATRLSAGDGPSAKPSNAQPCHAEGKLEIVLDCDYVESRSEASNKNFEPRIVLDRAKLWFRAKDDSRMRVELTFTNASGHAISESRTVYIAIDDESGQNHLRRPLPNVDFTKLVPGEPISFSETLRAPAFQPGPYTIYLWIPSNDPASKFDASHNFLLNNAGVPDEKSGLNTIGTFNVRS